MAGQNSIEEESKEDKYTGPVRKQGTKRDREVLDTDALQRIQTFTRQNVNVSAPMALKLQEGD